MKLCLLLVVAVLVGLASSNYPLECKEDEYILVDMCVKNCKPLKSDPNAILGACKVASKHRIYYDYSRRATTYYECWKCTNNETLDNTTLDP